MSFYFDIKNLHENGASIKTDDQSYVLSFDWRNHEWFLYPEDLDKSQRVEDCVGLGRLQSRTNYYDILSKVLLLIHKKRTSFRLCQ